MRNHRPHELEDLVTRKRTRRGEPGVTRSEWEPHGTCQRAGNIIGSVDCARGALVRQVPPAEEPAESVAKKRQCDKSHRSKERDECATRTSVTEGWPGIKRLQPQSEGQLSKTSGVFEGVLKSSHRSDASD